MLSYAHAFSRPKLIQFTWNLKFPTNTRFFIHVDLRASLWSVLFTFGYFIPDRIDYSTFLFQFMSLRLNCQLQIMWYVPIILPLLELKFPRIMAMVRSHKEHHSSAIRLWYFFMSWLYFVVLPFHSRVFICLHRSSVYMAALDNVFRADTNRRNQ